MWQRLLTQPRVLVFYLTQIFYPVPSRLSIEHDIAISTSLFNPWTTLPCIAIVLLLVALGLSQIKKRPVLAFGILFYFLNHVIESSVLGLELIFEHRNYLPSLFLFFPVSVGIKWVVDYYYAEKRLMYYMLISFFTLLIIGIGSSTYIRNMAWASEKSLWEDAMIKAPLSARPAHNLAWGHYEVVGQYDKAMELYKKSVLLRWHSYSYKADAFYGMAGIYFRKGKYRRAVELYRKGLKFSPKDEMTHQQLALSLMRLGRWDEALKNIDFILSRLPDNVICLNLKGFILLKQGKPRDALIYFKKCLRLNPYHRKSLLNIGAALSLIGEFNRSEWFLRIANEIYPKDVLTLLWLIDTKLKTGDKRDIDRYMDRLFNLVAVNGFRSIAQRLSDHTLMVPVSGKAVILKIAAKLETKSDEITQLGAHLSGRSKE
jgi:tetratricopeptide (TPR) repeat protein